MSRRILIGVLCLLALKVNGAAAQHAGAPPGWHWSHDRVGGNRAAADLAPPRTR